MSDDYSQAEEYFDLLVECAKKLKETKSPDISDARFWEVEVGKAWRQVYHHMTRGKSDLGVWRSDAIRHETALRFAALSRMAAMAAWDMQEEDYKHNTDPLHAAKRLTAMGEQSHPRIR
jgi:hypothetical protein